MIGPIALQEYTAGCISEIEGLNYGNVVIDDSQLTKFLEQRRSHDNQMLFFIIPEYPAEGNSSDNLIFKNEMMCMVLQKADPSNTGHDDFLLLLENTLQTLQAILRKLQRDKLNPNHCPQLRFIDESSFYIRPVWSKAQCHGWSLEFHLRSPF